MLKYNQNVRNGSAKARMWMICHVTALTVSFGFTSHAAAMQEGEVQAAAMQEQGAGEACLSGVSAVFVEYTGINQKLAHVNIKPAEEVKPEAEPQTEAEEAGVDTASQPAVSFTGSDYERELLASIIFCEAGNQSFTGQVAVGAVVMNRIANSSYPNTMEEVIYQPGQFGPAGSGWLDQVRASSGYTASAMQAAEAAMAGENPIGGCLYFDQGGYGMQIGAHYFH